MDNKDNLLFQPIDPLLNPNLFGHKDCENAFISAMQSGHCHHAWLLSGIKGIGKFTFACRVARFIFSTIPDVQNEPMTFWQNKKVDLPNNFKDGFNFDDLNDKAETKQNNYQKQIPNIKTTDTNISRLNINTLQLNEYDEVFNKIKLGTFSDLKIISPDLLNNKKEIPIDDIRKIYDFFHVSSSMHDYRVVIIDSIDDLNVNSANALLKILEEPPEKTIFLLVCHKINNVLDTIKSRARILNFKPLNDELIERLLYENIKGIPANLVNDLNFLCSGSIGSAYDLYNSDIVIMIRSIKDLLQSLPTGHPGNIVNFATDLDKNRYKFSAFKKLIIKAISFASQLKLGISDISNLSENLQDIIKMISINIQGIENLEEIKQKIENLFYKCDEVNLDRESVIILTLKYLGGI